MMERVTKHGEIMRDLDTLEYVVWDEIYANEVCRTPYLPLAEYAYKWYCENFLREAPRTEEEIKA